MLSEGVQSRLCQASSTGRRKYYICGQDANTTFDTAQVVDDTSCQLPAHITLSTFHIEFCFFFMIEQTPSLLLRTGSSHNLNLEGIEFFVSCSCMLLTARGCSFTSLFVEVRRKIFKHSGKNDWRAIESASALSGNGNLLKF